MESTLDHESAPLQESSDFGSDIDVGDIEEAIARAAAAAVSCAESDERSDSILSLDAMDDDTSGTRPRRLSLRSLPTLSEDAFIESESVEAAVTSHQRTKLLQKGSSIVGGDMHRQSIVSSSFAESVSDWEQGTFHTRQDENQNSPFNDTNGGDRDDSREELDAIPESLEGILRSCGALTLSLNDLQQLWRRSEEDIVKALHDTRVGEDFQMTDQFSYNIRPSSTLPNPVVLLLHSAFATFCHPPPSLQAVADIFQLECDRLAGLDSSRTNVDLPQDAVVSVSPGLKGPILALLLSRRHLLALPREFQLSFFRILTRVLTNETDDEYDKECLMKCSWTEEDDTFDRYSSQNRRAHLRAILTDSKDSEKDKSKPLPQSTPASSRAAELQKRTHERVNQVRAKREAIDKVRKEQSWIVERMRESRTSALVSKKPNQVYTIVRFCAGSGWDGKTAVSVLLDMIDAVRGSYQYLLSPLIRLVGLLCTAGVDVSEMRRMLALATERVESADVLDNLLMVRALTTAAEGDATSLVGKANPKYFFSFGKSPCGLSRTIHSLPHWPFRNDFGMAVWFRCESFDQSGQPKLVSISSPQGAGIEVSLMPLEEDKNATVIVVTVRDAGSTEVEQAIVRNCVLLPRVWYHIAIRHTRSRMKGVFSLSARQQVSVLLDGKLLLTEPLKFPATASQEQNLATAPKSFLAGLQIGKPHATTVTIQFGSNFDGQTGALYLFQDNVSDATLRAVYRSTAGSANGIVRKGTFGEESYESKAEVGKTVVEMNSVDADEIVMHQQERAPRMKDDFSNVMDLKCDADDESESRSELARTALRAKLFLVWDPRRTEKSVALDLHSGAHVTMVSSCIQPWHVGGIKNVIASVGGVQALLPMFDTLLSTTTEVQWQENKADEQATTCHKSLHLLVPSLLSMVAAFLRRHDSNAREMMRCGGIDIIEQKLKQNQSGGKPLHNFVGVLRLEPRLGRLLVDSLIELRLACQHYDALERAVFSRLLFNVQLWFGGSYRSPGIALYATLLPVLAALTKASPQKVRDTVGVRPLVERLHFYTDVGETEGEVSELSREPATESFDRSDTSGLLPEAPLTIKERRHVVNVMLGMAATILQSRTVPAHLSSILDYVSFNADYEWEQGSQQSQSGMNPNVRIGTRLERHFATIKATSILSVLLKARPANGDLIACMDSCCGGSHGSVSWILSTLVNTFDDEMRSIGIRCLADYLDILASKSDTMLHHGQQEHLIDVTATESRVGKTAKKVSMSFTNVGKSLSTAIVGNPGMPTSKPVSVDVVYKLLWHLLKCHRARMGKRTHASLIYLLLEDRGNVDTSDTLMEKMIVADSVLHTGFVLSLKHDTTRMLEVESVTGKRLRQNAAVSMVLRILRFLPASWKEKWLLDLVTLTQSCPANIPILVESTDWQSSLFHVISDAVEEINSKHGPHHDGSDVAAVVNTATKSSDSDENQEIECEGVVKEVRSGELLANCDLGLSARREDHVHRTEAKFNLSLMLYSTLLGFCFRQGGEKGINAIEQAASLERVCVNGHDVFCLILNHLLSDLLDNGTVNVLASGRSTSKDRSWFLKESARQVTEAILSKASNVGMDASFALRQWHGLRHLAVISSCVVAKSGCGMGDLFDWRNQPSAALDPSSGGIYGIRLPETNNATLLDATEYIKSMDPKRNGGNLVSEQDRYRNTSVRLASQTLALLDAFIFPDSLDASLPVSQLHGLALVRSNEGRLGTSQGPILASLIRLSLVLLSNLEPSSVKFLQCCSRLRCFLHWALELIRESVALAGYSAAFHDLTAPLDRLLLAVVLLCHRAIARCSAVLSNFESDVASKIFHDEESRKKNERRLLRVSFELREIVATAYRGRNEVLRAALSKSTFEALQISLEHKLGTDEQERVVSKEAVIRAFLHSEWVTGYRDMDIRRDGSLQIASTESRQELSASHRGYLAVEELSSESTQNITDYNRALNDAFKIYLDDQKNWAETDLVRDLEYDGDVAVKRLAVNHRSDLLAATRMSKERSRGATSRWQVVVRQYLELWTTDRAHWRLADHPDCLARRILLTRNRDFNDHANSSYELMLGRERERAERDREERRRKKEEKERREKELLEVVKRNSAFIPYGAEEGAEDDDEVLVDDSTEKPLDDAMDDSTRMPPDSGTDDALTEPSVLSESTLSEKTDQGSKKQEDDVDLWAKTFVWSDTESVVARFDEVMVVTLRTITVGKLLLTTHGLYFNNSGETINVMTKESGPESPTIIPPAGNNSRWRLIRLREAHGRRFMLRAQAIELFFADGIELFLNFSGGSRERDRFYAKLRNSCKVPLLFSPKSLNPRVVFKKSKISQLWRKGKISNFEYLMHLNKMAGRTFNDVTQYPVLPWVLCDYTSDTIDLSDSRVYRDLSKPVGALNEDRLASLIERYKDLASFGFADNERFLYGSHYSSPGVVLHFLIRQEPFTSMAIDLQSGRFDCPDRLFFDMAGCWRSCMTSTSDVKELVPELFTCPEVFLNTNEFPLGHTQDRRPISNVSLPPWAKGSAHEFVRIHRLALESDHVSRNLNHWIDLIFGYKQRGVEAEAAHNIFHYLSYEGAVDMDKITDEIERKAAESHIQNFGQTPSQLIQKDAHPPRYSADDRWKPLVYSIDSSRRMRCHTPSKQFSPKMARGAVLSIQCLSDSLIAFYADMSVGSYKFAPSRSSRRPFTFKIDKHKVLGTRDLSRSRTAIKRGSAAPGSMEFSASPNSIGNWSFAVTVGGTAMESVRRKKLQNNRLTSSVDPMKDAEANAYLLSCGYWDDAVKIHSIDGFRLVSSEFGGHQGPIRCLKMGADGALMVTGGQDGTCRIWVVDHPDVALALSDGYVQTALGASNDGENLLTLCHILWGHTHAISCLDVQSDLDVVVSGDLGGFLCVHTIRGGEFIRTICPSVRGRGSAIRKVALDPHGTIATCTEDQVLHVHTINGAHLCSAHADDVLHDIKTCSSGEILVTGGDKGELVIRTLRDLTIRSVLDISKHGPIRCLSLTPDELNPVPQYMFIGSHDGMITVVSEDPNATVEHEMIVFG